MGIEDRHYVQKKFNPTANRKHKKPIKPNWLLIIGIVSLLILLLSL